MRFGSAFKAAEIRESENPFLFLPRELQNISPSAAFFPSSTKQLRFLVVRSLQGRQRIRLRRLLVLFYRLLLDLLAVEVPVLASDNIPVDNIVDPGGVTEGQLAPEWTQMSDR